MNYLLDYNNIKAEQPKYCTLSLWEHQKILLNKCEELEKQQKNLYALTDDPGTGKTYVILSLISNCINQDTILLGNSCKSTNIIIVTENIYKQWCESIDKFTNIKYKKFINYSDISSLYFDNKIIEDQNILLTTPMYYKLISDIVIDQKMNIKRIIIDEINNVSNYIQNDIIADNIWLISGTFDINNIGYFSDSNIHQVKCKDELYEVVNNLEEPDIKYIICENKELELVSDLFNIEELAEINGLGFTSKYDNMILYLNNKLKEEIKNYDEEIKQIKNTIKKINDDDYIINELIKKKEMLEKKYNISNKKLEILKQHIKDSKSCIICFDNIDIKNIYTIKCCFNIYCKNCIDRIRLDSNKCAYCRTEITDIFNIFKMLTKSNNMLTKSNNMLTNPNKMLTNSNDKLHNLINKLMQVEKLKNKDGDCKEIFKKKIEALPNVILTNKEKLNYIKTYLEQDLTNKSIIIFSNYSKIFDEIQKYLDSKKITNTTLDGGNLKEIEKQLYDFKNKKATILMANGMMHGCGINLEHTTDIILVHNYNNDKDKRLEQQIISRAQRPGRINKLYIRKLCYINEYTLY